MPADETKPGTAKTPKQLAAEARAASEAADRRRERTIRIVGGVVVLVVVVGLVLAGWFARGDGSTTTAIPTASADPNAALPADVSADTYGYQYGSGWTAANEASLPTLEIWQDFQCPICAQVEAAAGPQIEAMADDGLVKLLYRPAIFMDNNLASANTANGTQSSSLRATNAWGCAIDAGKGGEYLSAVFAAQPSEEGVGFTDQQLLDLATQVGITGADLTTFTTCVDNGTYHAWAANSQQAFSTAGIGGTPTALLNGVQIDTSQLADAAALKQLIADATAQ